MELKEFEQVLLYTVPRFKFGSFCYATVAGWGVCMEVQIYHSATQPSLGRMSLGINSLWQKYIFSEMYVCTVNSVLYVLLACAERCTCPVLGSF